MFVLFLLAQHPYAILGRLIVEVSRSYRDAPHLTVLLWMRDPPVAETST